MAIGCLSARLTRHLHFGAGFEDGGFIFARQRTDERLCQELAARGAKFETWRENSRLQPCKLPVPHASTVARHAPLTKQHAAGDRNPDNLHDSRDTPFFLPTFPQLLPSVLPLQLFAVECRCSGLGATSETAMHLVSTRYPRRSASRCRLTVAANRSGKCVVGFLGLILHCNPRHPPVHPAPPREGIGLRDGGVCGAFHVCRLLKISWLLR